MTATPTGVAWTSGGRLLRLNHWLLDTPIATADASIGEPAASIEHGTVAGRKCVSACTARDYAHGDRVVFLEQRKPAFVLAARSGVDVAFASDSGEGAASDVFTRAVGGVD